MTVHRSMGLSIERFETPAASARAPMSGVTMDILGVALLAVIAAACCLATAGVNQIHVNSNNDQVGYITAARDLLDTGHITGHLIYPSCLLQNSTKTAL